jgi:hypothetical protein
MADAQTSEVDTKISPVNVGRDILYADTSSVDEHLLM